MRKRQTNSNTANKARRQVRKNCCAIGGVVRHKGCLPPEHECQSREYSESAHDEEHEREAQENAIIKLDPS
jgi:hypothetical protein